VKTAAALFLSMIALALPARAGEMRALRVSTENGSALRSYYLHIPANAKPGAPLVIMLHGAGSNGQDDTVRYGWRRKAEIEHFVVVGPDASPAFAGRPISEGVNPRVWNDGAPFVTPTIQASEDSAMVEALIDEMRRVHKIDHRRVYIAGFSSGGNMAARLAQEIPHRIAAVMIAAGQFTPVKQPARAVPILYFSGDADPLNPVHGGETKLPWGATMPKEPHRSLIERWRALNECPQALMAQPDPSVPERVEAAGPCRDGSEVRYVLVKGLGHTWPVDERGRASDTLSATNEAWTFFRRFQLPVESSGK
jgi:polyhydroxybutyrate depolymerase